MCVYIYIYIYIYIYSRIQLYLFVYISIYVPFLGVTPQNLSTIEIDILNLQILICGQCATTAPAADMKLCKYLLRV